MYDLPDKQLSDTAISLTGVLHLMSILSITWTPSNHLNTVSNTQPTYIRTLKSPKSLKKL